MAKRLTDKQLIDQSLKEGMVLFKQGKLPEAERKVKSFLPMVKRVGFRESETYSMLALMEQKLGKLDEAYEFAENELKIHENNEKMLNIQIQVLKEKGEKDKLKDKSIVALTVCKPSDSLVKIISEFISDFEDEELTKKFVSVLQQLPLEVAGNYIDQIPDDNDNSEFRVKLLQLKFKEDPVKYSDLIYALKENGEYDESLACARMLPPESTDRLFIETLFGDDPMTTAKKHIAAGKATFKNWYEAAISLDVAKTRNETNLIQDFISGYVYLLTLDLDEKMLSAICGEVLRKFSKSINAVKAVAEAQGKAGFYKESIQTAQLIKDKDPAFAQRLLIDGYIKSGELEKAEKIINEGNEEITDDIKAIVNIAMWDKDKKDERLMNILKLKDSAEVAQMKGEAIIKLGDKIDPQKANAIFAAQLKLCGTKNPTLFALYGNFLTNVMHDEEKGRFLLKKAVSLGYVSDDAYELETEDLIKEGKLDEALEKCSKVPKAAWARLRSGLIYFQKKQFKEAAQQLQIYVTKDPTNVEAWTVLCYTYFLLSKIMSAISVAKKLRELGHPCLEMEARISMLNGMPLSIAGSELKIEETPLVFEPYILQAIDRIRRFWVFGRSETCKAVINQIAPFVAQYKEKWSNLTTVLKECGDFYIEAYRVTNEEAYINNALTSFMKRAELDKRGECFIDVAIALSIRNLNEKAILVLRRAIKAFPDNLHVWINLGIAYALANKLSFSRHCFTVASMMADDEDKSTIYSCCAAVALLMDDRELLQKSSENALLLDPKNSTVWELDAIQDDSRQYSSETTSFQNEASKSSISVLVDACIRENQPLEALGYAFMSGDRKKIANALEVNKQYEAAARYADDPETKERLRFLQYHDVLGKPKNPLLEAVDMFTQGKYDEASQVFLKMNNLCSILGAAACAVKKGKGKQAAEIVQKQIKDDYSDQLNHLLDALAVNTSHNIKPEYTTDKYQTIIRLLDQFGPTKGSIKVFTESKNDYDMLIYSVINHLKDKNRRLEEKQVCEAEELLVKKGTRESLFLAALLEYSIDEQELAINHFQQVCILSPSYIPRLLPLINKIKQQ